MNIIEVERNKSCELKVTSTSYTTKSKYYLIERLFLLCVIHAS